MGVVQALSYIEEQRDGFVGQLWELGEDAVLIAVVFVPAG
jgi:hypothetical protein